MDPTPIATNYFAQYGALGGFALSGWVVAYFLWGALAKARADLVEAMRQAREDAEARAEKAMTVVSNNTQAMTLLAERLQANARGG